MGRAAKVDVLIVSLGSTEGLRRSDQQLADSLERAGASVLIARASAPPQTRTMMLTDLNWARAARAAAKQSLLGPRTRRPRAVIYSSTTAALLWPRAGAIRFDAPSAGNRLGRHGLWQRPLERRRLRDAPLLIPCSEGAMRETPPSLRTHRDVLVVPIAVEPSGAPGVGAEGHGDRDLAAITYAANPAKKGLDRVLATWRRVLAERRSPVREELVVAGVSEQELVRAGLLATREQGVRVVGTLAQEDYRALLRRARVFICAPRREDYGLAQLEALADGCQLVTTPASGPYAALPIARELDQRLVGEDLAAGLRAALDEPLAGYGARARAALGAFSCEAVDCLVAEHLLPRLLPQPEISP